MRAALRLLLVAGCVAGASCANQEATQDRALEPQAGATNNAPAQALLDWVAAMRRGDEAAVRTGLTPAAAEGIDLRTLRAALAGDLARYARAAELRVLYTERAPGRVNVYFTIDAGELVGDTLIRTSSVQLVALPLVRDRGRWRVDSSAWLDSRIAALEGIRKLRAGTAGASG